jgi:hypothetical protein
MDGLRFRSQKEKHELSHLYEAKIKNMGNAGRNGGEYYTPRPLIRAMIAVVTPKIGERIYDGALGSAGFLCEAHDYLRQGELDMTWRWRQQSQRFFGVARIHPLGIHLSLLLSALPGDRPRGLFRCGPRRPTGELNPRQNASRPRLSAPNEPRKRVPWRLVARPLRRPARPRVR